MVASVSDRSSAHCMSKPHWTMFSGSKSALVASLPFLSTVSFMPSSRTAAMSHGLPFVHLADLGRRVRQLGLIEQLLVVVDERRVGGVRDADGGAVLADGEVVDQRRVELGHVEVVRRDQRLQVEQVVAEDVEAFHADRADDVRRVAGRDLDGELVGRDLVVVDLDRQVDLSLFAGSALKSSANFCSAAICSGLPPLPMPMNQRTTLPPLGPTAAAIGSGVMATRDGPRSGRGGGGRGRGGAAALGAGVVAPPQAAATMATIASEGDQGARAGSERIILMSPPPASSDRSPTAWDVIGVGRRASLRASAGCRPTQGDRLPALDARRISSVARITRRGTGSAASTASTSRRAISWPISSMGWRTLVSCGVVEVAIGESSKPTTATSSGTRRPDADEDGQRAGRHQVGRGEHGVDVRMGGQQPLHRRDAALLGEVADGLEGGVGVRPASARASR